MSDWSSGIFQVTVYFCAFTALMTLFVFIWSLFKKSQALIMFNKRMATLWVLIFLFCIVFTGGKIVCCLFFALLSGIGLHEYKKMIALKNQFETRTPWIYGFILLQYWSLYSRNEICFYMLIPLSVFILVPCAGIFNRQANDIGLKCIFDYVGLVLNVCAMSYMCAYLTLPFEVAVNGKALLLFVLILTLMSDFFQAICGTLWGKHHLVPTLSPHKTWEGLIGGGVLTAVLAWAMRPYLTPFGQIEILGIGFALNLAAFGGDVTISAIKRYAGVKDSSNLLPGHGGLLDRFDSILLTAPLLFWYVRQFYL